MQKYFFSKTTLHNTTPYYTISGASVRSWIVYKREKDNIHLAKKYGLLNTGIQD